MLGGLRNASAAEGTFSASCRSVECIHARPRALNRCLRQSGEGSCTNVGMLSMGGPTTGDEGAILPLGPGHVPGLSSSPVISEVLSRP
jgi:hypothetical protein